MPGLLVLYVPDWCSVGWSLALVIEFPVWGEFPKIQISQPESQVDKKPPSWAEFLETLLHGALSDGMHDRTDEECLEVAQEIRSESF